MSRTQLLNQIRTQNQIEIPLTEQNLSLISSSQQKILPYVVQPLLIVFRNQLTNKIQLNPKLFQVLNQFSSINISFISVCGTKSSGKSFLVDKIIQTCGYKGSYFSNENDNNEGIWMWTYPIVKQQEDSYIFILGSYYLQDTQLDIQNNQLDIQLLTIVYILSSCIVFNQKKGQNKKQWFNQQISKVLKNIQTQGINNNDILLSLPNLILLTRDQKLQNFRKIQVSSQTYFQTCQNFVLPHPIKGLKKKISDLPLNVLSIQFQESLQKLCTKLRINKYKKLCDVILNANMFSILIQIFINLINKTKKINLNVAWSDMLHQLYISSYNYSVINYTQKLKQLLQQGQPLSTYQLHIVLKKAMLYVIDKYNEFNKIRQGKQYYEIYYKKLIEFINLKQKSIIMVNKKLSKKANQNLILQLKKKYVKNNYQLSEIQTQKYEKQFQLLINYFQAYEVNQLDSCKLQVLIQDIQQYLYQLIKSHKFKNIAVEEQKNLQYQKQQLLNQKEKYEQALLQLQQFEKNKKKQLEQIKNNLENIQEKVQVNEDQKNLVQKLKKENNQIQNLENQKQNLLQQIQNLKKQQNKGNKIIIQSSININQIQQQKIKITDLQKQIKKFQEEINNQMKNKKGKRCC